MRTRISGLLLLFLFLRYPIIGPTIAQSDGFLPSHLQPITRENIQQVEQLAVIAPDGDDLKGSSQIEVQRFAEAPSGSDHWITSIDISLDGRFLVAGSYDTSVRVWDLATGERIDTLLGHQEMVNDVAFSPNGLLIASCSGAYEWNQDFSVRLWKTQTAALLWVLQGHRDQCSRLSFNPEGTRLASASFDGTIRIWNPETGSELRVIEASNDWVRSVEFDSTGHTLLSASNDGSLQLWDVESGKLLRAMMHDDWVFDAHFSPDWTLVASGSRDRTVGLWNMQTGNLLVSFQAAPDDPTTDKRMVFPLTVAFSPTGELLVAGVDTSIQFWDVQNREQIREIDQHTGQVQDLSFNADGTILVSAGFDGTIRFWGVPFTEE